VTAFQRLSPGPTIPELMRAEFRTWSRVRANIVVRLLYFTAASLVLNAARVLLRLGLIEPECAGKAFRVASTLTDAGLETWRRAGMSNPQRN
jgi:hypothetical protein